MLVLIGMLVALPGGLAALAGVSAMRHDRRLRRAGTPVWAEALSRPVPPRQRPDGPPPPTLLQYTLTDGRVVERIVPGPARKARSLRPGQKVLIWYDPQDPEDALVHGRGGSAVDLAFIIAGALFIVLGVGIATAGH